MATKINPSEKPETGGLPAVQGTAGTVLDLLTKNKARLEHALPKHLKADRLISLVVNAVRINPKLLECDQKSFLGSIMQAANLGLEIGQHLGHANLVPFWNSQFNRYDCQLIIGYRGYVELAYRSNQVKDCYSRIVYVNEVFVLDEGSDHKMIHKPLPPSKRGKAMLGVYSMAIMKDGTPKWEWMWAEEIEETKKQALANKKNVSDSPWNKFPEEMEKKTPMRRLAKWLPLSPEWQKAAIIDEYQEAGIQVIDPDVGLDLAQLPESSKTVEQKTADKENKLTEKLSGEGQSIKTSPAALAQPAPPCKPEPSPPPALPPEPPLQEPARPSREPGEDDEDIHMFESSGPQSFHDRNAVIKPGKEKLMPKLMLPKGMSRNDFIFPNDEVKCPPGGEKQNCRVATIYCVNLCTFYKQNACFLHSK